MKLHSIDNVLFSAGKTLLLTDFDGTYMPLKHIDVCKDQNQVDKKFFYSTFDPLRKYKLNKGDKFEINITSGRNLYEWLYFVEKLNKKGLKMPLPSKMTASNGADTFELSKNHTYIPAIDVQDKKDLIKKLTNGWDDKIRIDLKKILKNNGYKIVEAPINSSEKEYGKDFSIQKFFPPNSKDKFVSFRKDDNLHLSLMFNKQNVTTPQEFEMLEKIVADYMSSKNIKHKQVGFYHGSYTDGYPVIRLIPKVNEKEVLTKLFDAKLILEKMKKNNDLLIVAGDDVNDREILNPLNYLNLPADVDTLNIKQVKNYFDKNPEKLNELKKLPLVSLVFMDSPENFSNKDKLNPIALPLDVMAFVNEVTGKPKILALQRGAMFYGVDFAINSYAQFNKEFRKNMNAQIKLANLSIDMLAWLDEKVLIGQQPGIVVKNSKEFLVDEKSRDVDLSFLQNNNVKTIIDLRNPKWEGDEPEKLAKAASKYGINHVNLVMDGAYPPTINQLETFFKTIKNTDGNVFFHCRAGRDRTGMMACLYLAYTQGRSLDETFDYVFHSRNVPPLYYMAEHPDSYKEFIRLFNTLCELGQKNKHDLEKLNFDMLKKVLRD